MSSELLAVLRCASKCVSLRLTAPGQREGQGSKAGVRLHFLALALISWSPKVHSAPFRRSTLFITRKAKQSLRLRLPIPCTRLRPETLMQGIVQLVSQTFEAPSQGVG